MMAKQRNPTRQKLPELTPAVQAEKFLCLHLSKEEAFEQILPRPPVLSSQSAGWSGFCFQYHCQPTWETPEHRPNWNLIAVCLSSCVQSRRWLDGHMQVESLEKGKICICPANTLHKSTWDRECEFIIFAFDPVLIASAASESVN